MPRPPSEPDVVTADLESAGPLVTHSERQRILYAILFTLLLLPLLLVNRAPRAQASPEAVRVRSVSGPSSDSVPSQSGPRTTGATSTTSTTSTTTSTTSTTVPAPTTTAVRRVARRVPVTTAPPTTARWVAPTTAAPKPPVTAPPTTQRKPPVTTPPTTNPPAAHSATGQATYYRWKAGNCAQNSLPMGTVVTVTNLSSGRSASCVVGDRGGFGYPTIIDLDITVFQQIASPSEGRIPVRISW